MMMKKFLMTVCALSLFGGLAAAEADNSTRSYNSYYHWEYVPVVVPGEDVKQQDDVTTPLHGPWLLNPSANSITINWITRRPCAGGVEYREKGTEEFKTLWTIKGGIVDYSKDLHSIHITGLKPGTEYEYRLVNSFDEFQCAYHKHIPKFTAREIHSFRTLDPEKKNYKVFLTSDLHGTSRLCLYPVYNTSGAKDADFYFFLGDNVEDNMGDARYYTTFGFLDDMSNLWSKNKPTVFLRGNHDFSGRQMYQYSDYFPQPDGKTYQAFRQGPVLFICLDSLWIRSGVQGEQVTAYIQEQADWIKALKKTDDWKKAKFRVVMLHVPLIGYGGEAYLQPFVEALNDNTPAGRVHAVLAGHNHSYQRVDLNSNLSKMPRLKANTKLTKKPRYAFTPAPYTQVVCNLVEAMTIDVTPEKLIFKSHHWRTTEGKLHDHFEIYPDGTVKDLQPIFHLDLTPPPAKK